MIKFETVTMKNFLSIGDEEVSISINNSPTTLITGHNGAGKSTIVDAIFFSLYGKAFRNINKGDVVNSVNNKKCLLTISFSKGKDSFLIKRGIKPAVFEIYKNDELIDQDGSSVEYQKKLERDILEIDSKTFEQVVILSSTNYIPFMRLSLPNRRLLIEKLLDIDVFGKMSTSAKAKFSLIKKKYLEHKDSLDKLNLEKNHKKDSLSHIKDGVENLKKDLKNEIDKLLIEEEELLDEINNIRDKSKKLLKKIKGKEIDELIAKAQEKKNATEKKIYPILSENKREEKRIEFYEVNENCDTCGQDIDKDLASEIISESQSNIEDNSNSLLEYNEKLKKIKGKLDKLEALDDVLDELSSKESNITSNLKRLRKDIKVKKEKLENFNDSQDDKLKSLESAILELKGEIKSTKKIFKDVEEEYNDLKLIVDTLKDDSIKSVIIDEALPFFNRKVNEYLQIMKFHVEFVLDNEFNETILSRYFDAFKYDNFSEGEKQRIDLSLLLTWREVARKRNSVNTNLIILDEVFDSSLDSDGVEQLSEILQSLSDCNIVAISHRSEAAKDLFESRISVQKKGLFSEYEFEDF